MRVQRERSLMLGEFKMASLQDVEASLEVLLP